MPLSLEEIHAIACRFITGCTRPEPFGDGHINDTFRFTGAHAHTPGRYVLQRINRNAFPNPEQVMDNMLRVTAYLRQRIEASGGDAGRETIALLPTHTGEPYVTDRHGDVWRAYRFVEDALSYTQTGDAAVLRAAGEAFGTFCRMLDGFDAATLHETIVDFHHTPKRFAALQAAVAQDAAGRLSQAGAEVRFALSREAFTTRLTDARATGALPVRVTHNDTKLNNVLIDQHTGRGLCVIDLDTVMPGLIAYDFGDAIRFGASTAAEDEPDASRVGLSLPLFEAYTQGYLAAIGDTLTAAELRSLPVGACMMALELGMRFLTDFLNGDRYFKTAYPTHNLVRARCQFALLADMENRFGQMERAVLRG